MIFTVLLGLFLPFQPQNGQNWEDYGEAEEDKVLTKIPDFKRIFHKKIIA